MQFLLRDAAAAHDDLAEVLAAFRRRIARLMTERSQREDRERRGKAERGTRADPADRAARAGLTP